MSSKLLLHRAALCNQVRRVAVEAGELILEYFDGIRDMSQSVKSDGSPVTLADQEAERLIESRLMAILPDIPVIGEESYEAGRRIDCAKHPYFWLVDPLDGTKAFVRGEGDFTVNIALIHKNDPVLGVIYAPEKGEMYFGYMNDDGSAKALRFFEDSETEKEIRTRQMPKEGVTVLSSAYNCRVEQTIFLEQFKVKKLMRLSSSLKICAIASGRGDLYPRFGDTGEWDTAAGHAILRAAGGDIVTLQGVSLQYGLNKDGILNPHFLAASGDILKSIEFL